MHGGIGGVIRDSMGNWLLGFASHYFIHGSMEAELLAFYHGLNLAFTHGYTPLEVNLDVKTIITLLHTFHPLYANIIFDCRSLVAQLDDSVILHTYRKQNQVADSQVKPGCQIDSSPSIIVFAQPPPFV